MSYSLFQSFCQLFLAVTQWDAHYASSSEGRILTFLASDFRKAQTNSNLEAGFRVLFQSALYICNKYNVPGIRNKMSSRPSRPRAAVNYNEKEGSFQPAWLKSQQVQSTEDPSSSDGTKKTSSGKRRTAEKENAKQTQNSKKQASKAAAKKQNLVDSSSPEKEAEPAHKSKKEKVPAVAERGRNAGLVVVPIGEFQDLCCLCLYYNLHIYTLMTAYIT